MKQTAVFVLFFLTIMISASAQTSAQGTNVKAIDPKGSKSTPTVDQILDRYVQALGGEAALGKITSRVQKGSFEMTAMGVNGSFESYAKTPNKSLSLIKLPNFGVLQEGYNGQTAWSQDPATGQREKGGVELAWTKRLAEFHRDLKLKELYPKITFRGMDKVAGLEAYVVEAQPVEGSAEKWYFDVTTGLLLRNDTVLESPQGRMPAEFYYEDYREVDGVKLPFILRQSAQAFSFVIKLSEVKHNVKIENQKFDKPAAP